MKVANGKRRSWSSAEKLRIVLAGLQADAKVSELCLHEGITAKRYSIWRERLMNSLGAAFDRKCFRTP